MPKPATFCIVACLVFFTMFGMAHAANSCSLQIDGLDYPAKVDPRRSIQVKTHVTAVCTQLTQFISGRADLIDAQSGNVLSTSSYPVGYIPGVQGTVTAIFTNDGQVPSSVGPWLLTMHVFFSVFVGDTVTVGDATQSFTVQVGETPSEESVIMLQVLQNGGFENGLDGWQTVQKLQGPAAHGNPSISGFTTHSGSSALALNLISSVQGGVVGAAPPEIIGVTQTVSVQKLRGLRIQAWYMMKQTATPMAARLTVQAGDLALKYYVSYDTEEHMRNSDTPTSRSIFLARITPNSPDWGQWMQIDRDVATDFQSEFGLQGSGPFQKDNESVTVALEFIGFGQSSSQYQVMLWDDIQAIASVPGHVTQIFATTATTNSSSSVSASVTKITSVELSSETSETTSPKIGGLYTPMEQLTPIAVALGLVLIAAVLLQKLRRKPSARAICPKCGSPALPGSSFCHECGGKLS